jgi:hypothetical protein
MLYRCSNTSSFTIRLIADYVKNAPFKRTKFQRYWIVCGLTDRFLTRSDFARIAFQLGSLNNITAKLTKLS